VNFKPLFFLCFARYRVFFPRSATFTGIDRCFRNCGEFGTFHQGLSALEIFSLVWNSYDLLIAVRDDRCGVAFPVDSLVNGLSLYISRFGLLGHIPELAQVRKYLPRRESGYPRLPS
jgi:hypothetical protein